MIRLTPNCGLIVALYLTSSLARADSLELTNGHLIQGKFAGATESEISFQVGASVQEYSVHDIAAIAFDSQGIASVIPMGLSTRFAGQSGTIMRACMKTAIIGAIAGGGRGAAIGAGVGAGLGAASEIITKGDQVKVPSETLLDFTLEQDVSIPNVETNPGE